MTSCGWPIEFSCGTGVIDFWLGYRLDKKAKQRQLDDEEDSELEA